MTEEVAPEPLTKNQKIAMELKGPCPDCGITQPETEEVADRVVDWWRRCEAGKARSFGLENLRYFCAACYLKTDTERMAALRKDKAVMVRKKQIWDKLLPHAIMSARFEHSDRVIELANRPAWEWGRNWNVAKGNAWIFGTVGTGKTFLARCIMNRAIDEWFLKAAEITGQKWVETAVKYSDHIAHREKLKGVDILLIEDIDKATWTEQSFDMFFELINYRFDAKTADIDYNQR